MHCRRPFILASVAAVAVFSLLATGCGGGGSSSGVASVASSTTSVGTTNRPLAFAQCMRSHGIPNWPDPIRGGVFDKFKLRQLGLSVSRVRAIEDGPCNHLLPNYGSGPQTAQQTRTQL